MKYLIINSLTAVGCFAAGYLVKKITTKKPVITCSGVLRIDNSEPEEESKLFLELEKDTVDISKSEYVTFKVLKKDYLSRRN